jgi:hypothetical protein
MCRALTTKGRERRGAPRYLLGLSVRLTSASGVTKNVSATGVLFEAFPGDVPSEGRHVGFSLSLCSVACQVRCRGRIVRVERAGPRCLVASTIEDWQLECPPDSGIVKVTAATDV